MGAMTIICGDDEFLKERAAFDVALSALSSDIFHFRLPEQTDDLSDALDLVPMDGRSRTIIVWGATKTFAIPDDADVIFVSAKGKTLTDVGAKRVITVKKPKEYNGGEDYVRWILKEGDRLNIDLSRVASALYLNTGTDLRKICSEINKIRVLTDPGGVAEPAVARGVMCFSAELTPRHIVDAVCEGHPAKAIAFYDKLQEGGCETGWIIAYMQRHVIQQLRAELLSASGTPSDQLPSMLNLHPVVFRNTVMLRMGLWAVSSLRDSLATFCNLDLLHKRGVDVSRWGLEPELIRLSEEAKHNVKRRGN